MFRYQILPIAWDLFARHGYRQVTMARIAAEAGIPVDALYRAFARKEDLAFELYHRLALALEERAADLPEGKLARRFGFLMDEKIALLERFREPLQGLFETMLDPKRDLGVMSAHMELIRRRVRALFQLVATGATDTPADPETFARHLYRLHLGLVFLWFQNRAAYQAARGLVKRLLQLGSPFFEVAALQPLLGRVDRLLHQAVEPHDPERADRAEQILRRIFRRRRLEADSRACLDEPCPQCFALHRPRLEEFLAEGTPIQLVLPGFPAKSPNRSKVLGSLPDTAEELALRYLQDLCSEIRELHPPGARLILCSDGHVFSDLVGVPDQQVSAYNQAMRGLLADFPDLDFFNLEDLFSGTPDYPAIRSHGLLADPLEAIRDQVQRLPSQRRLFDGLHRFLFEDALAVPGAPSRTQLRKQCKERTYQVIQRSHAWGRMVAGHFPRALRLSIHPQAAHSEKIGMMLTPPSATQDVWLTPWHGTAVLGSDGYRLVKRQQAEAEGLQPVFRGDRAVHFLGPR